MHLGKDKWREVSQCVFHKAVTPQVDKNMRRQYEIKQKDTLENILLKVLIMHINGLRFVLDLCVLPNWYSNLLKNTTVCRIKTFHRILSIVYTKTCLCIMGIALNVYHHKNSDALSFSLS